MHGGNNASRLRAKWAVIATNEYRVITSSVRPLRRALPILIVAVLALYVAWIGPAVFSLAVPAFLAFLASQVALATMELTLLTIAVFFLLIPLTNTLRDVTLTEHETLMSAPVSAGDILLGKFLGQLPFYALGIGLIAGTFAVLLNPVGLDPLQILLTVGTFAALLLASMWIGVVIAAAIRTRLGRSPRGKDLSRAIAMLIALPPVGLMYALMSGGMGYVALDSTAGGPLATVLAFFPTSWGADAILGFAASPGNFAANWDFTVPRLAGVLVFTMAAFGIGLRLANRVYDLEAASSAAVRARPEGTYYRALRSLAGRRGFADVFVAVSKDYARRLENLSRIAYFVGLLALVMVFFSLRESPEDVLVGYFMFPLFAALIVGEVTTRGKDVLFLFRKSPAGEGALVRARLVQGWLLVVPLAVVYAAVFLPLTPGVTLGVWLGYTALVAVLAFADVVFVLGFFLISPVFTDNPRELFATASIALMVSVFATMGPLILIQGPLELVAVAGTKWAVALATASLGWRNLRRIE